MTLVKGQTYSRKVISDMLGGSMQWYLPRKGNRITCGCFRIEPKYNPDAPEEIILGKGSIVQRTAEVMSQQTEPIPIFIFKDAAAWEYVGDYRCVGYSTDPNLLKQKEAQYPQRGTITGVLRFKEI